MLKSLHTFVRKAAAALLMTAAGTLPMLADGTIPYRASFNNEQMRYSSRGKYSKIKSTDIATYGEVGAPALPVRTYRFVVPVYTGKFTVSMTLPEKASETVTLDTPVMPIQRPVKAGDLQEEKFTIDTKAYNKVYAPKAWVVDDHFVDGSNHIVTVAVMPVEYNPVASTMKYYPYVDIKLNYADVAANEMSSRPVFTKRPDPNLDLSKIAVNGESPRLSNFHPIEGEDNRIAGTYIIISPIEYISAFKELAEWKRNKGYTVKLDTLDTIIARYPNGDAVSGIKDDAGRLRAYLIDCFAEYGRSYVLLAGDHHTNFPIRLAFSQIISEGTEDHYAPTDVYFSDMTGNWDANKNGKYGERASYAERFKDSVSYYPDMIVGRLLCKNAQEVENYTRKLMLYERNPGLGDYSYLSKGFVSFSNEDPFIASYGESRYEKYIKNPYHSKFTSVKECLSEDGDTLYKASTILDEMKNGYGFNIIAGHGQPHKITVSKKSEAIQHFLWAIDDYNNQTHIDTKVGFDNLSDHTKPSILFASSCTTIPFDQYNSYYYNQEYTLGASYIVAGLYGGVSYIGGTRTLYEPVGSSYLQEFFNQIDNGEIIGYVFSISRYNYFSNFPKDNYRHAHALRTALIGDPEMNVWTKAPKKFNVAIGSSIEGETVFGSAELPGAYISVSDGKDIVERKYSITNTSVSISDISDKCVTFTKPGCLPQSFLFIDKSIINDERTYFMTSGTIKGFWITPGGNVTIYASGDVTLDGAFNIYGSGILNIITDGNIWLKNGTLDIGGTMNLKARGNIHRTSQFKLKGGFLQQSKIQ